MLHLLIQLGVDLAEDRVHVPKVPKLVSFGFGHVYVHFYGLWLVEALLLAFFVLLDICYLLSLVLNEFCGNKFLFFLEAFALASRELLLE